MGRPRDSVHADRSGKLDVLLDEILREERRLGNEHDELGYRIIGSLGSGATADVWHVWDKGRRRSFAMKVLKDDRARLKIGSKLQAEHTAVLRLIEEAHVTSQLDHPGIVSIDKVGVTTEGRVFFTMELVRGLNLAQILERESDRDPVTLSDAVRVLAQAAETVAYAHERGVQHYDLKPSNIMVNPSNSVYVVDWGLAAVRVDVGEGFFGSPAYMAPEQAEGKALEKGPAIDVYAVGATLYHILTGSPCYAWIEDAPDHRALLRQICLARPRPIRSVAPDAPEDLTRIAERAMAHVPRDRYRTMDDLVADLRAWR